MALCVHRLARAVMPPTPALATALLFVAYRMWAFPHWHMVSYSTSAIFFATLAVTALAGGLPAPSLRRIALAGVLGALAVLCKQDSGAAAVAALGVLVLAFPPGQGRLAGAAALAASLLGAVVPALAYFAARGALADLWVQTVIT